MAERIEEVLVTDLTEDREAGLMADREAELVVEQIEEVHK